MTHIEMHPAGDFIPENEEEVTRRALKDSPLLEGFGNHTKNRFSTCRAFLAHGGLTALTLPGLKDPLSPYEHTLAQSARHIVSAHPRLQRKMYTAFQHGGDAELFLYSDSELTVMQKKLTQLHMDLWKDVGKGKTIEELAKRYIRPAGKSLSVDTPRYVETKRTLRIGHETVQLAGPVYSWNDLMRHAPIRDKGWETENGDFIRPTELMLRRISEDIDDGFEPKFFLYEESEGKNDYGVDLTDLSPGEIDALANGNVCERSCEHYHGSITDLKEGEFALVARVDAKRYAKQLLSHYRKWTRHAAEGKRYQVLIPAQADQTTIGGILDYLLEHGIEKDEIRKNFFFELSDLCPTPLLRVYAEMKRRDLLENSRITSTDVFAWGGKGEKYDFICADYFIDLFDREGEQSQRRVVESLAGSLAAHGELVLTGRCGTAKKPLSKESVLGKFYEVVDRRIYALLEELEGMEDDRENTIHASRKTSELIALLYYRQLRNVFPFQTREELGYIIEKIHEENDTQFGYAVTGVAKGKAKLTIRARKTGIPIRQDTQEDMSTSMRESHRPIVQAADLGELQARLAFRRKPAYPLVRERVVFYDERERKEEKRYRTPVAGCLG